jgi:hypothetical protein
LVISACYLWKIALKVSLYASFDNLQHSAGIGEEAGKIWKLILEMVKLSLEFLVQ